MGTQLPTLVIVSGSPGAGKTTLARWLATELSLPLILRDELKEVLMDCLGCPDRARSSELGRTSYAVLFDVLTRLLDASVGAVVESNFRRGLSERDLNPFVARSNAVLLHCETSRDEVERRYVERSLSGERHPGHHDQDALLAVLADLNANQFEPLELQIPTLRIDTTDGYVPSEAQILQFVKRPRTL